MLVQEEKIISEDTEIAQTFSDYFKNTINDLKIIENKSVLSCNESMVGKVEKAIRKFETHPSIISIKENVNSQLQFSFARVSEDDVRSEINSLSNRKAGTFMNIPTKQLKQVCEIVTVPLMEIWNVEIIQNTKFPARLKLADISPIFKKLDSVLVNNYRPVSVLPIVSKVF